MSLNCDTCIYGLWDEDEEDYICDYSPNNHSEERMLEDILEDKDSCDFYEKIHIDNCETCMYSGFLNKKKTCGYHCYDEFDESIIQEALENEDEPCPFYKNKN